MIFIGMHSQESQFHNKCLICSIKLIIYVQIASFVKRAFRLKPNVGRKVQKVILQPVETCQTKYRINLYDVFIINVQ